MMCGTRGEEMETKITVLVVSFNPQLEQIKKTVKSVILQKDVDVEIIVTDDGSAENYFEEIGDVFKYYNYKNFKLLGADKNSGTCKNIVKGLLKATGKYVKTIAPGDYFHNEYVLKNWRDFMEEKKIDVSFGNSIYYYMGDDEPRPMKVLENPQLCEIYNLDNFSGKYAVLDYLFLKDVPNGACFFAVKDVLLDYMSAIEGKIVYAEDMVYRKMLADGIKIIHFDEFVILYEFGTGISTSSDNKWDEIISNERKISNHMIIKHNSWRGFNRFRLNVGLQCMNISKFNVVKYIVFPELLFLKMKKDKKKRYTSNKDDFTFYKKL